MSNKVIIAAALAASAVTAAAALPAILLKSTILAFVAGFWTSKFNRAVLWQLAVAVLSYQILGTVGELKGGDIYAALQDFRNGIPGMLLQIFGGWFVINRLMRR